jgi:hypothetical protein
VNTRWRGLVDSEILSSDVSEIKLAFSIPQDRPTPNIASGWNTVAREAISFPATQTSVL